MTKDIKKKEPTWTEEIVVAGGELVDFVQKVVREGNVRRLIIKKPDGEVLLEVPDFDFSWQTVYYYEQLKQLPEGTRVEYTAWFENSTEKAQRYGFDATRTVRFGPAGRFHDQDSYFSPSTHRSDSRRRKMAEPRVIAGGAFRQRASSRPLPRRTKPCSARFSSSSSARKNCGRAPSTSPAL